MNGQMMNYKISSNTSARPIMPSEVKDAMKARFVREEKQAEESVANGHFVTSKELHEFLGV